ncbi:hypothetical protein NST23_18510 [Brevibacillus sp. FSL K6-0770]|nr:MULTISPECIES: hypothetical protein [unclassified Brevibacillus]MDH6352136.1 hypothetical protein [Brevibacillus sp. 1238]
MRKISLGLMLCLLFGSVGSAFAQSGERPVAPKAPIVTYQSGERP